MGDWGEEDRTWILPPVDLAMEIRVVQQTEKTDLCNRWRKAGSNIAGHFSSSHHANDCMMSSFSWMTCSTVNVPLLRASTQVCTFVAASGIRHVSVHQLYELFVLDVVDQSVGDRIASLVCPPDIEFFLPFWGRSCSLGLNLGIRFGRGGTVRRRLLGCGLCQSSLTSDVNGRQWPFLGWAGQRTAEKHGI